jgi:putative endonuclease
MNTGSYWVYILASRKNGTLYIGVTSNLPARLEQHRNGRGSEFVKRYKVNVSSTRKNSHRRRRRSPARSS